MFKLMDKKIYKMLHPLFCLSEPMYWDQAKRQCILYSYFMPVCNIVKLLPLGTVDDLRPSEIVHQGAKAPRGNSLDYTTNRHEITVLLPNTSNEILSSVS